MEIVDLPLKDLVPNAYNPNVVEEAIMLQLKKDIERVGVKQPVIVREDEEKKGTYIIIDGEHRWRVATDLGLETIPCEVMGIDENEAKIMTITMNRFRGEFDTIKLAVVLKSLQEVYSAEELEERLGYNQEQLQSYEDLLNFDIDSFADGSSDAEIADLARDMASDEGLLNEFIISLTLSQLEVIEAAMGSISDDYDRASALEHICRKFLEENFPQVLLDIAERGKQLDIEEEVEETIDSEEAQE